VEQDVTPLIIGLFGIACFLIGFSKAGFGGAMGFLITPVMALVLPVQTVVGLMLPVLMVGDIFTLAAYWRRWDVRLVRLMLAGAIVGVAAATFLLVNTPSELLKKSLAVLAMLFVIYRLLEQRILGWLVYRPRAWHGVLAGGAGGFTSALANAGGPLITIYLLLQKIEPALFIGTSSLFFGVLNVIKVPFFLKGGLIDFQLLGKLAWLLPLVALGVLAGRKLVRSVKKTVFDNIILAFLLISSVLMLL
jgi:hypothetical protein